MTPARLGLIAGSIAVNALAGLGLVAADEQAGSAHLPLAQLLAARPALAASFAADRANWAQRDAERRADHADALAVIGTAPMPWDKSAASAPTPDAREFVIKRILPVQGAIRYGDWHWDEKGVPPGPLVITVDLDARVLSAFRNGYEIGTTAVLLGAGEKPTPLGMFPITQKDADHHSSLYNDAPMPYMLRLTDDGVTIHGTNVRNGYASHGCVGVPTPFAKKLFGEAHLGDRVYITRGKQVGIGDSLIDK